MNTLHVQHTHTCPCYFPRHQITYVDYYSCRRLFWYQRIRIIWTFCILQFIPLPLNFLTSSNTRHICCRMGVSLLCYPNLILFLIRSSILYKEFIVAKYVGMLQHQYSHITPQLNLRQYMTCFQYVSFWLIFCDEGRWIN